MATEEQVFSESDVNFGQTATLSWYWSGDNSVVPQNSALVLSTLTFNYFPSQGGVLGRASISGRNAAGSAVWMVQVVYVEPKKTLHLTFPAGLRLEAGGRVELGFLDEGPGSISVSANGKLLSP